MTKNIGLDEIEDFNKMSKWFFRFSEQTTGSDMYQFLSKKIASDSELLTLAATADQSQPVPNLFLAAVNFLLYKIPSASLCHFYPNHSGKKFYEDGFFEAFKLFCIENAPQMTQIMNTRLVQTNEVRRCALLLPAIIHVSECAQSEIVLFDVGASSGLNLLLNQYFYQYSDGTSIGDANSHLKISCEIKNGHLPLNQMPKIVKRVGIDLNPIDLNDPDEKLWTLSLVWPDQAERIRRLKSAIQILKNNPVELHKGDATKLLPSIMKNIPANLPVCVMHSFTLNQFTTEARESFEKMLCLASKERDVWRVGLEWLGTESPQIILDHYISSELVERKKLANCHQHGEWIDWLAN